MKVPQPLLEVESLVKHFAAPAGFSRRAAVRAVDGVSLQVFAGETLGLVGESGSGKTTLGRCMLRLYDPNAGRIRFAGRDITRLSQHELRPLRRQMQMVFQDPYSSLNPRRKVGQILAAVLRAHDMARGAEVAPRVAELLASVGLGPEHAQRYPRAFSGGQRQRIGIARALASRPKLVIADEAVSALDVSIQAQVLNLLLDLQAQHSLTYVIIAHDLGMIRQVCDRVGVMHLGKLVELGGCDDLYGCPIHPYTEALLSVIPVPDPAASALREKITLLGEPPSPMAPPAGCRFHTRCRYAADLCHSVEPRLIAHRPGHAAACHFPLNVDAAGRERALAAVAVRV
jgi:oligopeptide/dipeptide ABC transporter ATP-binding protein